MKYRRRKLSVLLAIALPALVLAVGAAKLAPAPTEYKNVHLCGHEAHVVSVDLRQSSMRVSPIVAATPAEFERMMENRRPRAAINGTYFDEDYRAIGDVVAGGKVMVRGWQRSAIAVTRSGKVEFRHRSGRARFGWAGYAAGLAAGPMLVTSGQCAVTSKCDGFSRRLRAPRSAVGLTADGKLLLVVVQESVTLEETAKMMLMLGARNAMNLDGGSSCALYGDGRVIVNPYVKMSTVLVVK